MNALFLEAAAAPTPVFDPLVSRHDTLVGDWGLHASDSLQARWNLGLDRWSLGLDFKILLRTIPAVILGLGRNKSVLYIEIEQQFGRPAPDQPWGA